MHIPVHFHVLIFFNVSIITVFLIITYANWILNVRDPLLG